MFSRIFNEKGKRRCKEFRAVSVWAIFLPWTKENRTVIIPPTPWDLILIQNNGKQLKNLKFPLYEPFNYFFEIIGNSTQVHTIFRNILRLYHHEMNFVEREERE